jgi:hypothetical protein
MSGTVRQTLESLNATHKLPVDASYVNRIDALRAAVDRVLQNRQPRKPGGIEIDTEAPAAS